MTIFYRAFFVLFAVGVHGLTFADDCHTRTDSIINPTDGFQECNLLVNRAYQSRIQRLATQNNLQDQNIKITATVPIGTSKLHVNLLSDNNVFTPNTSEIVFECLTPEGCEVETYPISASHRIKKIKMMYSHTMNDDSPENSSTHIVLRNVELSTPSNNLRKMTNENIDLKMKALEAANTRSAQNLVKQEIRDIVNIHDKIALIETQINTADWVNEAVTSLDFLNNNSSFQSLLGIQADPNNSSRYISINNPQMINIGSKAVMMANAGSEMKSKNDRLSNWGMVGASLLRAFTGYDLLELYGSVSSAIRTFKSTRLVDTKFFGSQAKIGDQMDIDLQNLLDAILKNQNTVRAMNEGLTPMISLIPQLEALKTKTTDTLIKYQPAKTKHGYCQDGMFYILATCISDQSRVVRLSAQIRIDHDLIVSEYQSLVRENLRSILFYYDTLKGAQVNIEGEKTKTMVKQLVENHKLSFSSNTDSSYKKTMAALTDGKRLDGTEVNTFLKEIIFPPLSQTYQ